MKNKKKIILVALLVAAIAIWYFYIRKPKAAEPAKDPATPPTQTAFSYGGKRLIVPSHN